MPSSYTPNYNLNQWEASDRVQRVDFNADNAKIDGAIKAQAEALEAESSARAAGDAALAGKLGNCKVVLRTYVGDGTYGSDHPTYLSFDGPPPTLVFLTSWTTRSIILHKDIAAGMGFDGAFYINWTDEGVSWYSVKGPEQQFNLNMTYNVIMFYLIE